MDFQEEYEQATIEIEMTIYVNGDPVTVRNLDDPSDVNDALGESITEEIYQYFNDEYYDKLRLGNERDRYDE